LGITAHWIKQNETGHLSLEASLIAFHHLVGQHGEKGLEKVALDMLDCTSATLKVRVTYHLSVLPRIPN
ncbi:hypothetical protein PAXRUDRAFT_164839, partial [Paxillus rubicundulus Ve08.2h10]